MKYIKSHLTIVTLVFTILFSFSLLSIISAQQSNGGLSTTDQNDKNYNYILQVIHDELKHKPTIAGYSSQGIGNEAQGLRKVGVFVETDDKDSTVSWLDTQGLNERHVFQNMPFIYVEIGFEDLNALYKRSEIISFRENTKYTVDEDVKTQAVEIEGIEQNIFSQSAGGLQTVDPNSKYTGSDQVIAVLDTGFSSDHEFYGDRVIYEACYSLHDGTNFFARCRQNRLNENPAAVRGLRGIGFLDDSSSTELNGYDTPEDEILVDTVSFSMDDLPSVDMQGRVLTEADYILNGETKVPNKASDCGNYCLISHGTRVVGVAAGKRNADTPIGIPSAPAEDAKIVLLEIYTTFDGYKHIGSTINTLSFAKAIDKILQLKKNGVNIVAVNLSFGIKNNLTANGTNSYERFEVDTVNKNGSFYYSGSGNIEAFAFYLKEPVDFELTVDDSRVHRVVLKRFDFFDQTNSYNGPQRNSIYVNPPYMYRVSDFPEDDHHLLTGIHVIRLNAINANRKARYRVNLSAGTYDIGDNVVQSESIASTGRVEDQIQRVDDVDWYHLVVTKPGDLILESEGNKDLYVELHDASAYQNGVSGLLKEDDNNGEGSNFKIEKSIRPGTFYIKVQSRDTEVNNENYTLSTTFTPTSNKTEITTCETFLNSSFKYTMLFDWFDLLSQSAIAVFNSSGNFGNVPPPAIKMGVSVVSCIALLSGLENIIEVGGTNLVNGYVFLTSPSVVSPYVTDILSPSRGKQSSDLILSNRHAANERVDDNNRYTLDSEGNSLLMFINSLGGTSYAAPFVASVFTTLANKYSKADIQGLVDRIINSGMKKTISVPFVNSAYNRILFYKEYKNLTSKLQALNPIIPYSLTIDCDGLIEPFEGNYVCDLDSDRSADVFGRAEPKSEIRVSVNGNLSEVSTTTDENGDFSLSLDDYIQDKHGEYEIEISASDALFEYIGDHDNFLLDVEEDYSGCVSYHKRYSECTDSFFVSYPEYSFVNIVDATVTVVQSSDAGYIGAFAEEKYGGEVETTEFVYEGNEYIISQVHSSPRGYLKLYFNETFQQIEGVDSLRLKISDISSDDSTDLVMVYDSVNEGYISTEKFQLSGDATDLNGNKVNSSYTLEISF